MGIVTPGTTAKPGLPKDAIFGQEREGIESIFRRSSSLLTELRRKQFNLKRKLNHSFSLTDTNGEEVTLTEDLTHTVNRRPDRYYSHLVVLVMISED